MMRKKGEAIVQIIFTLLAALLLAMPAVAADFTNCSGDPTSRRVVGRHQRICYELAATESTDSGAFVVRSESALICLDSHTGSEANGAARIHPRKCLGGVLPAANPEFECITILDNPLDGTQGAAATQNACIRVGPGVYFLDVTVPVGGAPEAALVLIQAESLD